MDVRFNEEGDKIIASRFIVQGYNVFDSETDRQLMEDLRKIAHDSPLNVTVFHQFFIFFDQVNLRAIIHDFSLNVTVFHSIFIFFEQVNLRAIVHVSPLNVYN